MIEALRTPDAAFAAVPDFAYEPRYLDDLGGFAGLRMAYVDEGPRDAEHTFLCLHGEPTWSFLYRKMLPVFVAAGGRVVAPDFFGFGRSDKPVDDGAYSFGFHRDALLRFIERLDLRRITLVCQDWGGLLGMTLPLEMPDRFARLIAMNTTLATGDVPVGPGFLAWQAYANRNPDLDIAWLIRRGTPVLSDAEAAAYAAPYPDARYKAGVRAFPKLVPTSPDMDGAELSRRARAWWQTEWAGAAFLATGVQDPVLGVPAARYLHSIVRNSPEPVEYPEGGHFLQEWGDRVARDALRAFGGS
ncbi:MAG: putative haloalkane dehalogenase [Candidatus Eremiobacteraeota bacterium]|nr:putative haloalkane dehalogenase [Candidatus Eremiobacteraeota bacterium]